MCNFRIFLSKFFLSWQLPLLPRKLGYFNARTPKTLPFTGKILHFLHRAEISVILADFYLNLVVTETPFAPWEIQIAYLNSTIPKPYHNHIRKIVIISHAFLFFSLNLVTMATPFAPLKFLLAYLNSPTRKTLIFMRKIAPISCTELKSVQFWLIIAQIWLPW